LRPPPPELCEAPVENSGFANRVVDDVEEESMALRKDSSSDVIQDKLLSAEEK
jgi:hypothetical protein